MEFEKLTNLFTLTQRSSKIQSYYQMLDMELGIFPSQILYYEVKIPSDEKFSNSDNSRRLWLGLKRVEIKRLLAHQVVEIFYVINQKMSEHLSYGLIIFRNIHISK